MFGLSNNVTLPTLPALAARSTWAIVFAAVITVFNTMGIDILGFFSAIGAGSTPEEVIKTGNDVVAAWQTVAPLLLGILAWIERRAPNFRLTFWRRETADTTLRFLGALSIGLLMIGLASAPAAAAICIPMEQALAELRTRFGEVETATFSIGNADLPGILYVNPATGSWTLARLADAHLCIIASGGAFDLLPQPPPGDPA